VDEVELDGKNYWEAYSSLTDELRGQMTKWFDDPAHLKFLKTQFKKMLIWSELTDKLR